MKKYQEQYNENIKLPPAVYKILSEYVVYILITDKEYNDTNRMIYSLIVRNMMIIRKNSYNKLLAPEFITPMYPFSDLYRKNENHIQECPDTQIVPDIFECDSFEEMDVILDEDNFSEIKQLAQQAAMLKYQELICEIKSKGIEDPFVLAYYAANKLAVKPQWKYVDSNPVKTLMNILPSSRKNAKLKNIKAKLKDSKWYTNYESDSKSSLLLNYIKKSDMTNEISDLQLSDLEFAIYTYYELFLEELITD